MVDPQTRVIWELDPSGSGWFEVGIALPPGTNPPLPKPIPAISLETTPDAVKSNSARSFALAMREYNKILYQRYTNAFTAFSTGKGVKVEPPSPAGFWGNEDFSDLYFNYALKDIPMPLPREIDYNQ